MKFIEIPHQIDLMSLMMISQGMYTMIDSSIDDEQYRIAKNDACSLMAAMFCSGTIHLHEKMELVNSPTLMAINEPDIKDGVYVYLYEKQLPLSPPVIGSIDDALVVIRGSINVEENPEIDVYHYGKLIVTVKLVIDGAQVVPNIISEGKDDITETVVEGINMGISQFHMSKIAGYKKGMEDAASGVE